MVRPRSRRDSADAVFSAFSDRNSSANNGFGLSSPNRLYELTCCLHARSVCRDGGGAAAQGPAGAALPAADEYAVHQTLQVACQGELSASALAQQLSRWGDSFFTMR